MRFQRSIPQDAHSVAPHLTDLCHTLREFFTFVKDYLHVYQERFGEKEVRDYYGQVVSCSAEKIDLMLTQFLHFTKVSIPIKKTDTVRILIEDVLERRAGKLEEKRIHLSKKFEESLPETIVPKAQLFFILNGLIECMITVMSSEGELWISTKTVTVDSGTNAIHTLEFRKYVELMFVSKSSKAVERDLIPPPGVAVYPGVESLDLILPFVKEIVSRNRGMMKCQLDEKRETVAVRIRFPMERRYLACYELPETTERNTRDTKSVLSSKMEIVRKMAGGIAHELNNILTVIIGNADLLLHEMRPHESTHRLVRAIMEAGERGAHLGRNLLIVGHGHPVKPVLMNLNDFILSMRKELEGVLGERIQCHFLLKPDLMPIQADPHMMKQVISNLLSNAREAMHNGGKVKIVTENIYLDEKYCHDNPEATPGDHARLTVSDTGAGIASNLLNCLFEPYPNIKPGGGGLGLSTVYSIVKQFNGHITVHTKEGEGTTFEICIPGIMPGKGVPKIFPDLDKKVTILVVEPESELSGRIHRSLAEQGYTVHLAANGEEAISEIKRHTGSINLLIANIVLPGKSGVDLAKELWTKYPKMKTIFLTSCPEDWKFIFKEAVQVVAKPVDLGILLEQVRQVVGK